MYLLLCVCFFLSFLQRTECAHVFDECEKDYFCFYDEPSGKPSEYKGKKSLPDKSTAIVMIHAYAEKKYRVKLQGLDKTVTKIEVKVGSTPSSLKKLFSCLNEKEKKIVTFQASNENGIIFEDVKSLSTDYLRCEHEFPIKKPATHLLTMASNGEVNQKFELFVNGESRDYNTIVMGNFLFCDTSRLKYKTLIFDKTKSFKKVKMHLNDGYCAQEYTGKDTRLGMYSHFEYRPDENSDYVKVLSLNCVLKEKQARVFERKWELELPGGKKIQLDYDTDLDVRCVGDAKFFCDYLPKAAPGKIGLIKTPNNAHGIAKIETKLECPTGYNFIFIEGRAPAKDGKFVCTNIKGRLLWIFHDGSVRTALLPDGREVYCDNERNCKKIPNSMLHGAVLKDDNLPVCHLNGQLQIQIGSSSEKRNVKKFECNRKQGQIYYTLSDENKSTEWKNGQHIYCHYKDEVMNTPDEGVRVALWMAVLGGLGVGLIGAAIMGFGVYFAYKKRKESTAKGKNADATESTRYSKLANKVDEHSGGSKKSGMSSGSTKKSNFDIPFSKMSKKEKKKGIFTKDSDNVKVLHAPTGKRDLIKQALENNEKRKYSTQGFPEGYKFVYREDCKEMMEAAMDKHKDSIQRARQIIRERKAEEMEKRAKVLPK